MAIVTVAEMRMHMHLEVYAEATEIDEQEDQDQYIASLINMVQKSAEDFCGRKFAEDDAPEPVRLAVMLMVSHYYEYRDNYDNPSYKAAKSAFEDLLWPYRTVDVLF
jgi:hypothetical protein